MRRSWRILSGLALLAMAVAGPGEAKAEILIFEGTEILGANSTIGGVALGAEALVTYRARFDSTADLDPDEGSGGYLADVSFEIEGHGAYQSAPGASLYVVLGVQGGSTRPGCPRRPSTRTAGSPNSSSRRAPRSLPTPPRRRP
ncbi:hypothetical protein [Paludisphaera sp.]|uniref:hypothetical protein n=1 Tax=Paludisphaera sp. TaxID=2017432 RepID=UPI00301E4C73